MAKIWGQLENAQLENKSSDYSAGPVGRIWWNTTSAQVKVDDGTNIRALIRNDGKAVFGNNGTANNNIRLHRGASAVLQFVLGGDATAEGSLSTSLAQISAKHENYATAGLPSTGNSGRAVWNTDLSTLQVDTGAAWKDVVIKDLAQVITAKDIDGGTASNTSRITIPKDTTGNLASLTRKAGTVVYDTTLSALKFDDGSNLNTLATTASTAPTSPRDAQNYNINTSVGSSALTISLKDSSGADPSGGSPCKFAFRSTTATTGDYTVVSATAATSIVVSSGSTLGHQSGKVGYIYVYALNNGGAVELAVSSTKYDDGTVVSTTAEGGAGAADSASVVYSTTARTSKAIRMIARLTSTQATAGTWAAVPTQTALYPTVTARIHEIVLTGTAGYGSTGSCKVPYFTTVLVNTGTAMTLSNDTTNGANITINEAGVYAMTAALGFGVAAGNGSFSFVKNTAVTTSVASAANADRLTPFFVNTLNGPTAASLTVTRILAAGDVIRIHTNGASLAGSDDTEQGWSIVKVAD